MKKMILIVILIITLFSPVPNVVGSDLDYSVEFYHNQLNTTNIILDLNNETLELGNDLIIKYGLLNNSNYLDGYNFSLLLFDQEIKTLKNGTTQNSEMTYRLESIQSGKLLSIGNYSIQLFVDLGSTIINKTRSFSIVTKSGVSLDASVIDLDRNQEGFEIYSSFNRTKNIELRLVNVGNSNAFNVSFTYFVTNEPVDLKTNTSQIQFYPIISSLSQVVLNFTVRPQNLGLGEITLNLEFRDGNGFINLKTYTVKIYTLPIVNVEILNDRRLTVSKGEEFTVNIFSYTQISFTAIIKITSDLISFLPEEIQLEINEGINPVSFKGNPLEEGVAFVNLEIKFIDTSDSTDEIQLISPITNFIDIGLTEEVVPEEKLEWWVISLIIFNLLVFIFFVLIYFRGDLRMRIIERLYKMRYIPGLKFPSNSIIVDGSNVAWESLDNSGKPKISNLVNCIKFLNDYGFRNIVIVVDAALRYQINEQKEFDYLAKKELIKVMPAKTKADNFILRYSLQNNYLILSNDLFKEFRTQFDWIDNKRVPYTIMNNDFYLHPIFDLKVSK